MARQNKNKQIELKRIKHLYKKSNLCHITTEEGSIIFIL